MSAPKPILEELIKPERGFRENCLSVILAGYEIRLAIDKSIYVIDGKFMDGQISAMTFSGKRLSMPAEEWESMALYPKNYALLTTQTEQFRVMAKVEEVMEEIGVSLLGKRQELVISNLLLDLYAIKQRAGFLDFAIDLIAGEKPNGNYSVGQGIKTRKSVAMWARGRAAKIYGRGNNWGVEL